MLNRIVLIGRLTRDPELRFTPNGHAVCSFTLAVDRPFTNQEGNRETILLISWFGTNKVKTALSIWLKADWPQWMAACKFVPMMAMTVNVVM